MGEIRLEPLAEQHLDAVDAMTRDREVLRFTRVPNPPPAGFARTWFDRYETGRADGTREAFAIVDGAGTLLGLALAPEIDRVSGQAELGYLVVPEARGRGVATDALRLLTDWAFDELGMLRLVLFISVANDASKRVAESSGYVREGVLRSSYVKPGLREDTEIWSRLPDDP